MCSALNLLGASQNGFVSENKIAFLTGIQTDCMRCCLPRHSAKSASWQEHIVREDVGALSSPVSGILWIFFCGKEIIFKAWRTEPSDRPTQCPVKLILLN